MEQCIKDIEKAIDRWNERSMFTIKGVKNLSRADLDTIILYAEYFDGQGFPGLMKPLGGVREVLSKYGMC